MINESGMKNLKKLVIVDEIIFLIFSLMYQMYLL